MSEQILAFVGMYATMGATLFLLGIAQAIYKQRPFRSYVLWLPLYLLIFVVWWPNFFIWWRKEEVADG